MAEFRRELFSQGQLDALVSMYEDRLAALRAANDRPRTPTGTATIRGRISECKDALAKLRGQSPVDMAAEMERRPYTEVDDDAPNWF